MPFWKRKTKKPQESAEVEVLYLSEEGDVPPQPHEASASVSGTSPTNAADAAEDAAIGPNSSVLFSASRVTGEGPERSADPDAPQTSSKSSEVSTAEPSVISPAPQPVIDIPASADTQEAVPSAAEPTRKEKGRARKAAKRFSFGGKRSDHPGTKSERAPKRDIDVDAWRKGTKGRPSQVFIGYIMSPSKRDAIQYAIGVAQRNAVNVVNTGYAVFPWRDGWAYEVHEGGPMRAYLPSILRFYDGQGEHAKPEDLIVYIETGRRMVRVERAHEGLTAFMMPEAFSAPQTEWLEPGPKLKPAAPVLLGAVAVGGAIFATGFLAMVLAFIKRPEPPILESKRPEIRFEQLPVSQWSTLLSAASNGYVDALEYSNGEWKISRAAQSTTDTVAAPPPPLPTPDATR